MCVSPITLDDGQQVACRNCKQCRENRVSDIVGRCIAESRTSVASHAFTLTYGRDFDENSITYGGAEHPRAAILTYSDFQKFMKLLRRHGHEARYLVAGEYGGEKGRAHWHGVLFWKTKPPKLPPYETRKLFQRFGVDGKPAGFFWERGWTWWSEATYKDIKYACKYVLKDESDEHAQGFVKYSKMPPLGSEYFADLARRMADQGLPPLTREYSFPDVLRRNGERRQFYMSPATADRFLAAWDRAWHARRGKTHPLDSELLQSFYDRQERDISLKMEPYQGRASQPGDLTGPETGKINQHGVAEVYPIGVYLLKQHWGLTSTVQDFQRDPQGHSWFYITPSGEKLIWTVGKEGGATWRNLKGEKAHSDFLRQYSDAATRARQDGRPWLIQPGQVPRHSRKNASPFSDPKGSR